MKTIVDKSQALPAQPADLIVLFVALLAIAPAGCLPHVTLTTDPERPYGAVMANEANCIAASATCHSVDGLVELIAHRLSQQEVGRGVGAA
jgi:hypothetical protein